MPFVDDKKLREVINYGLGMNEECSNCPLEETDVPCSRRMGMLAYTDCEDALYHYLTDNTNGKDIADVSELSDETLEELAKMSKQNLDAVQKEQKKRKFAKREEKWDIAARALMDYLEAGGVLAITSQQGEGVVTNHILSFDEDGGIFCS